MVSTSLIPEHNSGTWFQIVGATVTRSAGRCGEIRCQPESLPNDGLRIVYFGCVVSLCCAQFSSAEGEYEYRGRSLKEGTFILEMGSRSRGKGKR